MSFDFETKISAKFIDEKTIVLNPKMQNILTERGFGELQNNKLVLDSFETLYLLYNNKLELKKINTMTVHQDYEIKINLNELIEKRIPCCDLLHPDHCLTEKQVSEIAHDIRMDLNLHDLYKQVDQHIMNYVNAAGIDNKDHWVEPHLPDLERDLKEEVGIEFD